MAKVTFEFDSYEDADELRIFQKSMQLYCSLSEVDGFIRSRMKHGDDVGDLEYRFLERLKDECQILTEFGW